MAELTSALVTPVAETKILELAYNASKYIDVTRSADDIYVGGKLVSLLRVLNDTNSLLGYADKQSVIQGIIGIGKLKI